MPPTPAGKLPHNIDVMLRHIEKAVEPFAKAALFELADLGYSTPFEQLVACIIPIRSLDEVTLPAAQRLFEVARTPAEVAALTTAKIDRLIHPATFHERKAAQIQGIARLVAEKHNNELPCDRELMLSFPGVGPKCANLALGIACEVAVISVDVHVDRVTNRWGYVQTTSPEKTMLAFADHGELKGDMVTTQYDDARAVMAALGEAGIDYDDVIAALEKEGVDKFVKSWDELVETVRGQMGSRTDAS